ncbi:MAG TPA: hypothetical protein PLE19_05345 [Planctomycetota bacterium]|nr:hypothetical protein [Planctomycetota bacterium]HRR80891.1 hypothetical protein [Planctomycetota bacterium]HRT95834.1 hypothetical protein [Planctomycetota bacterium]
MPDTVDLRFGSNDVRLAPREWAVALPVIVAVLTLLPVVWPFVEPLRLQPDHRLPFALGNDYWMYSRLSRAAVGRRQTLVVGDSVVWGHYVATDGTLSHYLNELAGSERFANLGVDGIHPAAMLGLVRHYADAIRNRNVVLHCNLLWMSSSRHDLSTEKEFAFNHPTLVPQFMPRIPCYREPYSERVGIVLERGLPFHAWRKHVQIAYFESKDVHSWTLEHPYEWPGAAITLRLPSPDQTPSPRPDTRPWTEQGITKQSFAWVELETSLQWRFFRETVELLRARGNRVFVLVGPFNEHLLTEENQKVYAARKVAVEDWLSYNNIPYFCPDPLPSVHYADASHPLAEGYRLLAKQLFENEAFITFDRSRK